jgi:hypothetical protein
VSAAALVRVAAAAMSLLAMLLLALAACGAARAGASPDLAPEIAASLLTRGDRTPAVAPGLDWMATRRPFPFAYLSTGQAIGPDLRGDESLAKTDTAKRWSRAVERVNSLLQRGRERGDGL